jgi:drug/metabolite transporter (DMT)-like permease
MGRKDRLDAFGVVALTLISAVLGLNQVVIKVVNGGLAPVFAAGLRSAGGILCVWLLIRLMGKRPRLRRAALAPGLLVGLLFTVEFIALYTALDLGTVARTAVLFYTMPVWAALAAHLWLPGERLTRARAAGLLLAFAGVAVAMAERQAGGAPTPLLADLCALAAALAWAGTLFCVRLTALRDDPPETQLFWQVLVSAPLLILVSAGFGPWLRAPDWMTWAGLGFQIVAVVTLGFAAWFWLLTVYPAGSVAAFGFQVPVFGVAFGWLILGEPVGPSLGVALALVAAGLWLVNRPPAQVPQKV